MYETKQFNIHSGLETMVDSWLHGRGNAFDIVGYQMVQVYMDSTNGYMYPAVLVITIKFK